MLRLLDRKEAVTLLRTGNDMTERLKLEALSNRELADALIESGFISEKSLAGILDRPNSDR